MEPTGIDTAAEGVIAIDESVAAVVVTAISTDRPPNEAVTVFDP